MQFFSPCHKGIRKLKYTQVQKVTGQIYGRKKKSRHNQKIQRCLFDSKLLKKQGTTQGGDRHAGEELFSTCFVAVSTITVNPHYGLMFFTEEQEKSSESQAGA